MNLYTCKGAMLKLLNCIMQTDDISIKKKDFQIKRELSELTMRCYRIRRVNFYMKPAEFKSQ